MVEAIVTQLVTVLHTCNIIWLPLVICLFCEPWIVDNPK